ncbi:MAG: cytidylate kinase-like family protein [SAR202 cluster bacterium]|nr:cytidylate kinase-like family protein [SAR202 cluster bacterium]
MSIVALGGLSGGGSRLLGPIVAQKIGADYVDRLILTNAAKHIGATVEALHQREQRPPTKMERVTGLLQRILERSAVTGATGDPYFGSGATALLTEEFEDMPQPTITKGHEIEDEKYIEAMRKVIKGLASEGNVVLVGRGASIILKDNPIALRVGTVCRPEDRVNRVMQLDKLDRSTAEKTIIARDKARAYFYTRYFDILDPDDPQLYHIVVNTSEMDLEYTAEIIANAVRALEDGRLLRKPGTVPS